MEDHHAVQRHTGAQHRAGLRDPAVHPAVLLRAVRHRPDEQELRQVIDVRRGGAPLRAVRGHQLPEGCGALPEAGRGLRDLRRAVAALQLHGARRCHGCADAVGCHPFDRDPGELEGQLAGVRPARLQYRPLAGEQELGRRAGLGRRERVAAQLRHGFLHPLLNGHRPGFLRQGRGQLPGHRHLLRPDPVPQSDHRGPQRGAHRPRRGVRQRPVHGVRSGQRARGRHALLLRGQPAAAPLRGRDHPGRPGEGQGAGQVQLGEVAALPDRRYGRRSAGGRAAGPPDGRRCPERWAAPGQRSAVP